MHVLIEFYDIKWLISEPVYNFSVNVPVSVRICPPQCKILRHRKQHIFGDPADGSSILATVYISRDPATVEVTVRLNSGKLVGVDIRRSIDMLLSGELRIFGLISLRLFVYSLKYEL